MKAAQASSPPERKFAFKPKVVVQPTSAPEIEALLQPCQRTPTPIRPTGKGTSPTGCTTAEGGTVLDMTAMDHILDISEDTVTVQAGVTLYQLSDALAERGLELPGVPDYSDRTVGGAVCGGCMGPSMPGEGGLLASSVTRMKMVTADGRAAVIDASSQGPMSALRLSYGLLGIVHELTLRVRPIRPYTVRHRKLRLTSFAELVDSPDMPEAGLKFYVMPFRDRVYTELRHYAADLHAARSLPWQVKDWMENTAAPRVARSVARAVPIRPVRYTLVDGFNEATHALARANSGSNSVEHSGRFRTLTDFENFTFCTWYFPEADFARVIQEYAEFCRNHYREYKFRCDMPAVGFRVNEDRGALLSPSFGQATYALSALSTPDEEWKDFVIDFGEFAEARGGLPVFNQTKAATPQHVESIMGSRLETFRKVRKKLDPDKRLVNPFLMQYMR